MPSISAPVRLQRRDDARAHARTRAGPSRAGTSSRRRSDRPGHDRGEPCTRRVAHRRVCRSTRSTRPVRAYADGAGTLVLATGSAPAAPSPISRSSTWLPSATSVERVRASACPSRTRTAAPTAAGTPTSRPCAPAQRRQPPAPERLHVLPEGRQGHPRLTPRAIAPPPRRGRGRCAATGSRQLPVHRLAAQLLQQLVGPAERPRAEEAAVGRHRARVRRLDAAARRPAAARGCGRRGPTGSPRAARRRGRPARGSPAR